MIIALANQKGGVAKTTSTICLGGLLAKKGNVLVIDLDPQGNLTTGLGVEVADDQINCYDVITEQVEVMDAVVSTNCGLHLLPADINLAKGETEILTKVGNFYILKEKLAPVLNQFQHILIDCPPSLGLLTVNALSAADVVLIPVQCQFFALKGLAALLETVASVHVFDPVPKSIKFSESNLAGEPIHIYAKESKLVQPYQAIAKLIAQKK